MSDCFDHESDAWDSKIDGLDDAEPYVVAGYPFQSHGPHKSKKVKCKHCKKKKLHWVNTAEGWRLATKKGKLHVCPAYSKCTLNKH